MSVKAQGSNVDTLQRRMSFKSAKSFDSSITKLAEQNKTEEDTQQFIEALRLKLKKFVATSYIGIAYTNLLLILSVLSCTQYIVQTYINGDTAQERALLEVFNFVEIVLAALFGFDWFLFLFIADHKREYFFSFFAMIDFTTVIPIWLTKFYFTTPIAIEDITSLRDLACYVLYGMYNLRILRALRLRRKFEYIQDEVRRVLSNMLLQVVTMILFNTALMQYLERSTQPLPFHTWMYYIVVTTATVGYGDIAPLSAWGRTYAMFIILFAIISIPKQTNELIEKMNRYSVYSRASYLPRGNNKHVLVCGNLKSTSLKEFFNELFHDDHDNTNLNAVILQPHIPSNEIFQIINDPIFSINVMYLEGSALVEADLMRAKAHLAIAIFIMGDKFSSNPDEADAISILQQFSIRRFVKISPLADPLFCIQLIRPENRKHIATNEGSEDDRNLVVCLNELKMGVIAKNILFPGFSTLLFNLLCSFADDGDDDGAEEDSLGLSRSRGDFDENDSSFDEEDGGDTWKWEYLKGCDWEIYTSELSEIFEGKRFIDIAVALHAKLGVVLFALKIKEIRGKSKSKLLLNPASYVIPPKSKVNVTGFVIAKNKAESNLAVHTENEDSHLSILNSTISKTLEAGANAARRQSVAFGLLGRSAAQVASEFGSPEEKKKVAGWQTLMSNYEPMNEETSHQLEQLHQLEEQNLRAQYYLREEIVTIDEVTIYGSFTDEYPQVQNHIIVIAKGLFNLYDFIKPLRAKYIGRMRTIVILNPTEIPHSVWRRISVFDGIYYVRGSPLEENDIRRAGVFRASQVVVLSDPSSSTAVTGTGTDALVDADAIFCYQCVKRLNEKASVVIEIVRDKNVSYLDPNGKNIELDYKFTPQFAAGTLFTSSILDTIVCQTFYNPEIIEVINKLIAGTDVPVNNNKPMMGSMTNLHASLRKQANTTTIGSSLYQIPVPEKGLESKTYGCLVEHLAQKNILCIGLLRGMLYNMNIGPKANVMPYVFTNPSKDTELFSCDKVFVLSPKILTIQSNTDKKVSTNPTTSNGGNRKRVQSEDNAELSDHLRDYLNEIAYSNAKNEKAIESLSQHVSQQTDNIMKQLAELNKLASTAAGMKIAQAKQVKASKPMNVFKKQMEFNKKNANAAEEKKSENGGGRGSHRSNGNHGGLRGLPRQATFGAPLRPTGLKRSNSQESVKSDKSSD